MAHRFTYVPGAAWTFAGSGTTGTYTYNLPALAGAGTITVTSSSVSRVPDGAFFNVRADGVLILSSPCLVNGSQSAYVPPRTLVITVQVTDNCIGGGVTVNSWSLTGG